MEQHGYSTNCDSAHLSMDLWKLAKDNLISYIEKASHRHRLAHLIDENLLNYTFTPDSSKVVPVYMDGELVRF
jgi:phosphosulfolactate phosphohydrolase-like enzyme